MLARLKFVILIINVSFLTEIVLARRCMVMAPKSIRSKSKYSMSIATHGATEPKQYRVKIYEREEPKNNRTMDYVPNEKNSKDDPYDMVSKKCKKPKLMKKTRVDKCSKDTKVPITAVKTKTVMVKPDAPQIVNFDFDKDIEPGSYVLEVQGLPVTPDAFYEKQFLSVESMTFSTLIQTNKATYRPGELIKYRVILVDADTRPVNVQDGLTISLIDSTQNVVEFVANKSTMNGMYSGEFQTSESDDTGTYEIETECKQKKTKKTVEVSNAENPNFNVAVVTPSFITNMNEKFSVGTDCAYTFGKPVESTVTIKATPLLVTEDEVPETAEPVTITRDCTGVCDTEVNPADFKVPADRTLESVLIETSVQEKATGSIVEANDKTIVFSNKKASNKYDVILDYFNSVISGTQHLIQVQVRRKNGQPLPTDQSVKCQYLFDSNVQDSTTATTHELDASGRTDILINILQSVNTFMNFRISYNETVVERTVPKKPIHVQMVKQDNVKLNQKMKFRVGCKEKMKRVTYNVIGRGNVLLSQTVDMGTKFQQTVEIDATQSMAPNSSFVVHYITDDGMLISDQADFQISPTDLTNPFTISVANSVVKPNQELLVTAVTEPNSQISLSCTEQSGKPGGDVTQTQVYNDMDAYDNTGDMEVDNSNSESYVNMLKSGTLAMTDAMRYKAGMAASSNITIFERDTNRDYSSDILSDIVIPLLPLCAQADLSVADQQELLNQSLVRTEFSDSFLFEQKSTGSATTTVIKTRVPETVTSWRLSGFSMNPAKGLGLMAKPITFTTFKPFFVDVKLPEEAKVDEPMDCQVAVHNYLDKPTMVEVALDDPDNNFEVDTLARDGSDKKRKTVEVPANSCKSASFKVKPKKKGKCPVKIRAVSPIGCDANKKELMVQPAGTTITETMSRPLLLEAGNATVTTSFPVEIPDNAVPESVKMQLSVQGDKYSADLTDIPSSAPPASGEGGDLLSTLAVQQATDELNILYGTQSCETTDSMAKAVKTIQKVSDTQCSDGGYRADGDCDQPTRDTSYTLTTLRTMYNSEAAQSYSAKVLKAFDWLASIQKPDGSFPDPNPFPSTHKEGSITTSYAAFCLLEAGTVYPDIATKYASTIDKALTNIYDQIYNLDLLSLSYACRSFQLKGDARRTDILMRIEQKSSKSETSQEWLDTDGMLDDALPHILDSFNKEYKLVEAQRVGKGMTKRVVEKGDKIKPYQKGMMMKTLARHHKKYTSLNPFVWIAVPGKSGGSSLVQVNRTHKHVMRKIDVTTDKKNVHVANVGKGFVNLDLTVDYNLKNEDVVDTYDLQVNMKPIGPQDWEMEVCAKCKDGHKPPASVMNIEFPPGFKTSDTIQDYTATTNKVKRKELKGKRMMVHFEDLDDKPACLNVPMKRKKYSKQKSKGKIWMHDKNFNKKKPNWSKKEFTIPVCSTKRATATATG